ARATARQKEIAIRTALGASRFRLIRQMLTESTLLAMLGGTGGLLLAVWCTDLLTGIASSTLPRARELAIDAQTLLFTLLVSLLTGLLFGLAPAIQASKTNLNSTLKEGGRSQSASLRRGRLRSLLVVTQIALSLVLLVSAGLFIKSFRQLRNVSTGFDPEGVATMLISLPRTGYAESRQKALFFQQVLERVSSLPGVQAAGVVTNLPLGNSLTSSSFEIEGHPPAAPDESRTASKSIISQDYFRAMSIPLLKGRALSERDATDAPGVVVINGAMARRYFGDEDPLGKRLTFGGPEEKALYGEAVTREIVGIVGDVRFELEETAKPEMYIPYAQAPIGTMALVVRSAADPATLREPLRRAIREVDGTQTGYSFKTMEGLLSESVAAQRLLMTLTNIFASLALILAGVGIYGVIAFSVAQRTHELGIRIALGAQTADVLRLVVGQGMTLAGIGLAVGLAGALALTRFLSSLLYGVSPTDAPVFVGTAVLLGAVALLASYIPARRATKVDPIVALRHE
ncbi:MAG: ADOP family duplicated permease, partial [Pyrinomonadaceae bacterium MAG19_C2-C3]|nr:ADOP family duplicated permease [Pyrinomonadaceae bacterium MAG19_C2-C3]